MGLGKGKGTQTAKVRSQVGANTAKNTTLTPDSRPHPHSCCTSHGVTGVKKDKNDQYIPGWSDSLSIHLLVQSRSGCFVLENREISLFCEKFKCFDSSLMQQKGMDLTPQSQKELIVIYEALNGAPPLTLLSMVYKSKLYNNYYLYYLNV